MKQLVRGILAVPLAVALLSLGGAPAGTASASAVSFNCEVGNTQPCIRYCDLSPEGSGNEVPCGVDRVPSLTGVYTFSVPMDTATQNATGVPGDPGASGTANITLDLNNNRICATTTWSGIDSPVVGGHIHQGSYGQPENPAITLSLMPFDVLNGNPSGVSYCQTAPAGELWLIKECPREFHAVLHSKDHPVAAIRGQLGTSCSPHTTN